MARPANPDLPADPEIRRILVIKWSAMGDVVLASACFEDIFRSFPGREIHLNTLPPWDRLFSHDPRFSRVFAVDLRGQENGLGGAKRWLAEVRAGRYDLIVDLQSTDRARLFMSLLCLTGGLPRYRLGTRRRFPYNLGPATRPKSVHALTHLRRTLQVGGIPSIAERPVLYPGPESRQRVRALQAEHGLRDGHFGVFLPGCQQAGYLKRWGSRRFITLALQLKAAGVGKLVLLGAADERAECEEIKRHCGDWVVNLCGQTQVLDIVSISESARFIVANDTGTAHVASVTPRPMAVICGPTDPGRVKPAGSNVVALQADLFCINCYRKECSHHACMELVSADRVFETLRSLDALPG